MIRISIAYPDPRWRRHNFFKKEFKEVKRRSPLSNDSLILKIGNIPFVEERIIIKLFLFH